METRLIFSSVAIRIFCAGPFNKVAQDEKRTGKTKTTVIDKAECLAMYRG